MKGRLLVISAMTIIMIFATTIIVLQGQPQTAQAFPCGDNTEKDTVQAIIMEQFRLTEITILNMIWM
jgi:hypothetical protein